MKKFLLFISILFLTNCQYFSNQPKLQLSKPKLSLNTDDPVFVEEFAFAFNADRVPTATEPVVASYLIPTNWIFPWYNTTTLDVYDYKGGSNGSYLWQIRLTPDNLSQYLPSRSFSYLTRSLNTIFQISTTKDASVSYSVKISPTLSLTTGQEGAVILEIADDSGFTTNVQEITEVSNGNGGTLAIGLNLTQPITLNISGIIPAGKWARLRTVNTTGTPTFTSRPGQEVLL